MGENRKFTLAAYRVDAGYSRKYVAEYLGIAPSTVQNWEIGKTQPSQPMIEKLCELYNTTFDRINFVVR